MAVVQGHAARRRANIAPNTLVMAERGVATSEPTPIQCPVKRCGYVGHPMEPKDVDYHLLAKHSRHPLARDASSRLGWD